MCFSASLRKGKVEIESILENLTGSKFEDPSGYHEYYHLNGFIHGNLYIIKMDEPDAIYPSSWGLVPEWAKQDSEEFLKSTNTLNARSESIFKKSIFRQSANEKRCLILADGFFEPHHEYGVSIPYFCYQPSEKYPEGDLFLFAGLYSDLGDNQFTTTIITTEANEFFAEIHNKKKRMPLVLAEDLYEDWLKDGTSPKSLKELMAHGFTSNEFKAHPVSKDLYRREVDTNKPYIIEPAKNDTPSLF